MVNLDLSNSGGASNVLVFRHQVELPAVVCSVRIGGVDQVWCDAAS